MERLELLRSIYKLQLAKFALIKLLGLL